MKLSAAYKNVICSIVYHNKQKSTDNKSESGERCKGVLNLRSSESVVTDSKKSLRKTVWKSKVENIVQKNCSINLKK